MCIRDRLHSRLDKAAKSMRKEDAFYVKLQSNCFNQPERRCRQDPVSYTHLDVYKRQEQIGSPDLLILFTNTVSHKMVKCAITEAEKCNAEIVR